MRIRLHCRQGRLQVIEVRPKGCEVPEPETRCNGFGAMTGLDIMEAVSNLRLERVEGGLSGRGVFGHENSKCCQA
ncbi:hypothetical protein APY03_0858 [Variovorax sp. WDL1]|nr:hypothetical protein APY03_0858 [Variovorax sp. WDL1]